MVIGRVKTSIPLDQALMKDPDFIHGGYTIKWLEAWLAKRAGMSPRPFTTATGAEPGDRSPIARTGLLAPWAMTRRMRGRAGIAASPG